MKILSVISGKNDGCSYYRMTIPSQHICNKEIVIKSYLCRVNKFSSSPINLRNDYLQYISGIVWDHLKWLNRLPIMYKQNFNDFVWISRSLLNYDNMLDKSVKNVIYDFDDAVWLGDARHCFKSYCKKAQLIFSGNQFLYEEAKKYSDRVVIIPTGVDTSRYINLKTLRQTFNVGWIGSSSGYHYLAHIEQHLINFFLKHKDARLVIVSDKYPAELKNMEPYIDFLPWSREYDVEFINRFSIGIMPMSNTVWDLGKCSFKMLQYMACEVPIIASNIGMNREIGDITGNIGEFGIMIDNDDEWTEALETLYKKSLQQLDFYGQNGRKVVNANFSAEIVSKKIEVAFNHYL